MKKQIRWILGLGTLAAVAFLEVSIHYCGVNLCIDPATLFLISSGINLGTKLLSPKKTGGLDPKRFEKDLVMDKTNFLSDLGRRVSGQQAQGISAIKQAGAAGRLPSGAITSGVKGVQAAGAEALSTGALRAEEQAQRSRRDFFRLRDQFERGEAANRFGVREGFRGDLGQLTKFALLFNAGAFTQPGTLGATPTATGGAGAGASRSVTL